MSHGSQDKGGFKPGPSVEYERREAMKSLLFWANRAGHMLAVERPGTAMAVHEAVKRAANAFGVIVDTGGGS